MHDLWETLMDKDGVIQKHIQDMKDNGGTVIMGKITIHESELREHEDNILGLFLTKLARGETEILENTNPKDPGLAVGKITAPPQGREKR